MKKIIFLNLIAILALFTGCREEIPEYSGASGIYFAMSKTKGGLDDSKLDYTDNTSLPFAVFDKEDSILIVRVKSSEKLFHTTEKYLLKSYRKKVRLSPEKITNPYKKNTM